mmetsp:Transcript_5994/g.9278  ORF Transcript_5994/g.9278 Transcript_5994/m.9278 type:complete len:337 (+) Transcript_5994:133-1143(+)
MPKFTENNRIRSVKQHLVLSCELRRRGVHMTALSPEHVDLSFERIYLFLLDMNKLQQLPSVRITLFVDRAAISNVNILGGGIELVFQVVLGLCEVGNTFKPPRVLGCDLRKLILSILDFFVPFAELLYTARLQTLQFSPKVCSSLVHSHLGQDRQIDNLTKLEHLHVLTPFLFDGDELPLGRKFLEQNFVPSFQVLELFDQLVLLVLKFCDTVLQFGKPGRGKYQCIRNVPWELVINQVFHLTELQRYCDFDLVESPLLCRLEELDVLEGISQVFVNCLLTVSVTLVGCLELLDFFVELRKLVLLFKSPLTKFQNFFVNSRIAMHWAGVIVVLRVI